MKVFIDCGGHNGCSVRKFMSMYPDWREYTIHSFEPNPMFHEYYKAFPNVTLHKEAVWIEYCEKPFYFSTVTDVGSGSTLIRGKRTGKLDLEHPINVQCINFSDWLRRNFSSDDYIVVKFDIEGAEYPILRRMLADHTINLVKRLYVEFHVKHRVGVDKHEHLDLLCLLHDTQVPMEYWDALEFTSNKMVKQFEELAKDVPNA